MKEQKEPIAAFDVSQDRFEPHMPKRSFDLVRLFLGSSGFLNSQSFKDETFSMLSKSNSLQRDLRGLDRKFGFHDC